MKTPLITHQLNTWVLGQVMPKNQFLSSSCLYLQDPGKLRVSTLGQCSNVSVKEWIAQQTNTRTPRMRVTRTLQRTKVMGSCQSRRQVWRTFLIQTLALLSQVHTIRPKFRFTTLSRTRAAKTFSRCKIKRRGACKNTNFSSQKLSRAALSAQLTLPQANSIWKTEIHTSNQAWTRH